MKHLSFFSIGIVTFSSPWSSPLSSLKWWRRFTFSIFQVILMQSRVSGDFPRIQRSKQDGSIEFKNTTEKLQRILSKYLILLNLNILNNISESEVRAHLLLASSIVLSNTVIYVDQCVIWIIRLCTISKVKSKIILWCLIIIPHATNFRDTL